METFTRERFCGFTEPAKAKKRSDLLKGLLLHPGSDWKRKIEEFNRWNSWDQLDATLNLPLHHLQSSDLLRLYQHFRPLTGLGPEREVLNCWTTLDLPQKRSAAIPWQVWMHNLRSGHNVGNMIRTLDCFGWEGAISSGYTPQADHKSVQGAAMGTQNWMPWQHFATEDDFLESNALPLYALETHPEAVVLHEFKPPLAGILVVGNEELGIPPKIMDQVTGTIQIPMFGRKTSLNVSNAFALAAYTVRTHWNTEE
jgi:23S rRNA (guanosine2251-2'-O)-methyltransferase